MFRDIDLYDFPLFKMYFHVMTMFILMNLMDYYCFISLFNLAEQINYFLDFSKEFYDGVFGLRRNLLRQRAGLWNKWNLLLLKIELYIREILELQWKIY